MPTRAYSKKRKTQSPSKPLAPSPPTAATGTAVNVKGRLARKFVAGLTCRLADEHGRDSNVVIEGAFRAAVAALPDGKLRTELERDDTEYLRLLSAGLGTVTDQVDAERPPTQPEDGEVAVSDAEAISPAKKRGKGTVVLAESRQERRRDDPEAVVVPPCTMQLYRVARAEAENTRTAGDGEDGKINEGLRALAVNPRAPFDLLVDAVGGSVSGTSVIASSTGTLQACLDNMKILVAALAVDPHAAVSSPTGVAFYADRAARLAGAIASELAATQDDQQVPDSFMSTVMEGIGLMLRVLQIAALAAAAPRPAVIATTSESLILKCMPETTREAASGAGDIVPHSRVSIARILAHYSISMATCCSLAGQSKSGSSGLVRRVCAISSGDSGKDGGEEGESGSSESEDSDDEEETARLHGESFRAETSVLSQHLLTLCASHLKGEETATLEFLRWVGDACFATCSGRKLPATVAASLAPTCVRVIARLPRPAAAPVPSAALFLRRAYAFRVVESLVRSPPTTNTSTVAIGSKKDYGHSGMILGSDEGSRHITSASGNQRNNFDDGSALNPRPWDFIGAAAAPRSLLEFLGRPEAPTAVDGAGTETSAGETLRELAKKRNRPAAVGELLRSSEAFSPRKLGPLLEAMENLGAGSREADGEGLGVVGNGDAERGALGGFFVDTAGEPDGSGSGVLAPLRRKVEGDDVMDMDEQRDRSDVANSDSEEEGDGLGFVLDTAGAR